MKKRLNDKIFTRIWYTIRTEVSISDRSAGGPTDNDLKTCTTINSSNAGLQGCDWECFDNLPRWLSLDHHHLAEHFPLASLRRWFGFEFEPAHPWNAKVTRLLGF